MNEPRVMIEFAGCATDEESRALARRQVHDNLIAACPVRLGPVEWRHYAPDSAAAMLEDAGLAQEGAGLVAWLDEDRDGRELVVGSVLVPGR